MKEAWDDHKRREKESMDEKSSDTLRSADDSSLLAVTFDLEAVFTTPHAGDAQIYYIRKHAVYYFTLLELLFHQGICYQNSITHLDIRIQGR